MGYLKTLARTIRYSSIETLEDFRILQKECYDVSKYSNLLAKSFKTWVQEYSQLAFEQDLSKIEQRLSTLHRLYFNGFVPSWAEHTRFSARSLRCLGLLPPESRYLRIHKKIKHNLEKMDKEASQQFSQARDCMIQELKRQNPVWKGKAVQWAPRIGL